MKKKMPNYNQNNTKKKNKENKPSLTIESLRFYLAKKKENTPSATIEPLKS